ncbi:hypothetical protein TcBrA4_0108150 [Trypanosoma cruzi]|nr:hypothetical protein TcBrA4_0108150 [Trypanosoma cruzi]
MADESRFVALASYIAKNAPCRRLTGCLHSAPFEALCSFIQCDVTIIMAAPSLNGFECENTNDGKRRDEDYGDGLATEGRIICVSLYTNPRKGLECRPQNPALRKC